MRHLSEQDLIAFQMHEATERGSKEMREHLEQCATCAAMSESIAETLRVFSAEPVPQANLEHAWQRLRGGLPTISPVTRPARRVATWMWTGAGALVAAPLLAVFVGVHHHRAPAPRRAELAFHRPGPLTEQPVDPAIANHLDSAERLLTEVNHASGPLDGGTREQAHDLLLRNAVYVRKAHDQGDLAEASVLENLGRVLTTLDHEPPASDKGWHIRFEMNTDGLLLDIRILRQNDLQQ